MPSNYDHNFRGSMLACEALADSRNIPALLLLSEVGVERGTGIMAAAGLRTLSISPRRYGLSLAIGGAEVTPFELAEAYATLARGGEHRPATFTLSSSPQSPRQIISSRACWQTLASISANPRTLAISPDSARLNVAWKTGTSSGHRDAWCAAVTRQHTVVVWLGNATGRGAQCLVGQETAAPLALQIIAAVTENNPAWPTQSEIYASSPDSAPQLAQAPAARRLALLSPIDGTQIVYNTDLPPDRQQLLLRAAPAIDHALAPDDDSPLWWFIDGRLVGEAAADERLFWPPSPGQHEVRVVDAQGHYAVSRIRVVQ
jgi:membrane carboxypeptidase/penicillin-binding protein PbpC